MEIIGIIERNKLAWIREHIPVNAIVTTEDIKYLYVPCMREKKHTLSFYNVNNNYKICEINNDSDIKYA